MVQYVNENVQHTPDELDPVIGGGAGGKKLSEILPSAAQLSSITSQLAEITTVASKFNILATNADNHDNIINALEYLKSKGGGTLLFPAGTFKTSPISFQGYNNIVIRGVGRSYPLTVNTTIKIIGSNPTGSVGFQFCDPKNPKTGIVDAWTSKGCTVEGVFLECDSKCDVGINGNFNLVLRDVTVRHAIKDGIVIEDYTYPIYLDLVESAYNGRHGIYAKGPMTTCYFFKDVSCSGNTGYGIYIEGASSCNFTNVLCQTNVQGGLKINKVAGYAGSYFMTNLVFNNFYTEGNGTLTSNDPNFEGNCGVYITGYDKTSSSAGKARGIKFNGGSINAIAGGIAVKIDAVWGCKFSCAIGGTVDIASVGVYGLEFDTEPSGATVLDIGSSMALTSYHTITIPGKVFNGGLFPMRGRTQIYEFYLPTIAAGTTVNMNSLYQLTGITGITKGYAMLSKGSILGVKITKRGGYGGGYAGTITAKPVYYAGPDLKTDPPNPFSGNPNVALNGGLSDVTKSSFYPPDTYKFNADSVVGVQLTTSADYVAGTYDGYIAQLMVEI